MEASLRQIEATNPALFAGLVSAAVLDHRNYDFPPSPEKAAEIVQEVAPGLDNELAAKIGCHVSAWAVAFMTAEGLR